MFFATALKDYVDQLNDLALLLNNNFTVLAFLKSLVFYLVNSTKVVLLYIISFQWLTDFIELPCHFNVNYLAILEGTNLLEKDLNPSFFQFLETRTLTSNLFLVGILNSFFLALPLSVPHLLALRAFLINGLPAGIAAATGIILGQLSFFFCVFFGFEFILIPFLSFEPLNYILGSILLVNILHTLFHQPDMRVLNISNDLNRLFKLFGINFLLAWTEQTSLFQYFGNLTVTNLPTLMQANGGSSVEQSTFFSFFLTNSFYFIGLLVGSLLWTGFFGFLSTLLRNWFSQITRTPFLSFNKQIHKGIFILTFVLSLTTIPYYGLDYLISAPLGFISQDKALDFLKARPYYATKSLTEDSYYSQLFFNPVPFDRTTLLETVDKNSMPFAFEDYSVDSDNAWKNREVRYNKALTSNQIAKQSTSIPDAERREFENLQTQFLEDFYKTDVFYENLFKVINTNNYSKLDQTIDKMAEFVFNPVAYDYSALNDQEASYTRKQFRDKFYENPVYKALVHLDMIGFLQGQPKAYNLTAKDEMFLYERRLLFESYLNSVQDYKNLVRKEQKTSPYADKVYNQQFKGSLDLVRHYFAISLDQKGNSSINLNESGTLSPKKVLKFDQSLYKNYGDEWTPFLHEELNPTLKSNSNVAIQSGKINSEEVAQKLETSFFDLPKQRETTDSTPFYIGWDGGLRKFLVKKACTPGIPFGNEAISKVASNTSSEVPTYLTFQSWAFNSNNLADLVGKGVSLPYLPVSNETSLEVAKFFKILEPNEINKGSMKKPNLETTLFLKQTLPPYNWSSFISTWDSSLLFSKESTNLGLGNTLPPQLGGVAWPGSSLN